MNQPLFQSDMASILWAFLVSLSIPGVRGQSAQHEEFAMQELVGVDAAA